MTDEEGLSIGETCRQLLPAEAPSWTLNYPRYPTDGSAFTVFNVHEGASAGSSWRQVSPMDGPSSSVIPGGQSGSYFSPHYDDQLRTWADGEYKRMAFETPSDGRTVEFREAER